MEFDNLKVFWTIIAINEMNTNPAKTIKNSVQLFKTYGEILYLK